MDSDVPLSFRLCVLNTDYTNPTRILPICFCFCLRNFRSPAIGSGNVVDQKSVLPLALGLPPLLFPLLLFINGVGFRQSRVSPPDRLLVLSARSSARSMDKSTIYSVHCQY